MKWFAKYKTWMISCEQQPDRGCDYLHRWCVDRRRCRYCDEALAALARLGSCRLCIDDEELIDYWNNIDEDLELDMDVLDDVRGEAIEVRTANPWLRYGECLHRLREFGASIKEMDPIDNRLLAASRWRLSCRSCAEQAM